MFEFGLGVMLALFFVAAYLAFTVIFRKDKQELSGHDPRVTLNPVDTTHSIGSGKSRRVLTSGDRAERGPNGPKE